MANLFECGGGGNFKITFPEIILNGQESIIENDYWHYEGGYFYLPDGVKKITIENVLYNSHGVDAVYNGRLIIRNSNGTVKSFSFQDSTSQQNLEIDVADSTSLCIYVMGNLMSLALSKSPAKPHFVLTNVSLYI